MISFVNLQKIKTGIQTHDGKRGSIKKSKLDEIDGIGDVIKKRLLSKYKSIKIIRRVNIDDLMTVKGINAKIAKQIKERL